MEGWRNEENWIIKDRWLIREGLCNLIREPQIQWVWERILIHDLWIVIENDFNACLCSTIEEDSLASQRTK